MSGIWSFVGAMVLCYFVSRLTWRAARSIPAPWRLYVAHATSFIMLGLIAGFARAYGRLFALDEVTLYVVPTLIWLVYDHRRGRALPGIA